MVNIRPPRAGEERTIFWDLPRLRDPATTELVLATPRVGFMTTLAFFANWPTNPSNIVPGHHQPGADRGPGPQLRRPRHHRAGRPRPASTPSTSSPAPPASPATRRWTRCATSSGRATRSPTSSSSTLEPQQPAAARRGRFTVDGSAPVRGQRRRDLRPGHGRAPALRRWPGPRSCASFANSSSCDEDDPELAAGGRRLPRQQLRLQGRWCASCSPRRWSPTPQRTRTAETDGVVISIARRENLCARLGNRLGITDALQPAGRERRCPAVAGHGPQPVAGHPRLGLRPRRREAGHAPRPEPVLLLGHREAVHAAGRPAGRGDATGRWKAAQRRRRPSATSSPC